MELKLKRFSGADESTLGLIFVESGFFCYSLEDQHNEPKIKGETRIPAGRYQIILRNEGGMVTRYKKRFSWHGGMLWLQDVPGFTFIYMHVGNKDDDSDGCILTGDGQVQNVTERGQVTSSVAAYRRLYEVITEALLSEEVWIKIYDEDEEIT
ncbi:MAG: hypothetical protein KAJ19_28770 [Gammaproteobacteria bacterium]|nr:hypothetical protein [Gammaproteobacteria bacterium]